MNIVNIYENYNNYFNADLKAVLKLCSKVSAKYDYKIYLIGGIVRDLLLDQLVIANPLQVKQSQKTANEGKIASLTPLARKDANFIDIDITVEGDAIEFANILEKENVAKIISVHEKFGTAKVEIQGLQIDFASTRSESYPKKGHLPHVDKIGCGLKEDVIRRDFTINSLAISLNECNFAHLLDYVGGYEDLKAEKIIILHDLSFVDDPTRIIRALKFSVRLGFELDKHTHKLQEDYLKNINYDMGYKRVKSELKQTFELNSQLAFDRFLDEDIYKLITSNNIKTPKLNIETLINKYCAKHPWVVYLGFIGAQESDDFSDKLELTKSQKDIILGAKKLLETDLGDDFKIYKAFGGQKLESLLIFAALKGEEKISRYINDIKKIRLSINGNDLLALGLKPSKRFSEGLDYVLAQKLKRPNMKKEEELKMAQEYVISGVVTNS